MAESVLFTESTADLSVELVKELGVEVMPMEFMLDGKAYHNYPDNRELDPHAFYDALRAGGMFLLTADLERFGTGSGRPR